MRTFEHLDWESEVEYYREAYHKEAHHCFLCGRLAFSLDLTSRAMMGDREYKEYLSRTMQQHFDNHCPAAPVKIRSTQP